MWLKRALNGAGFRCRLANSLRTAEKSLQGNPYTLILLDEGLPDGSGTEFCKRIRQGRASGTPIALLTGNRRTVEGGEWYDAGADTCWPKTHNGERLISLVRGLIRRAYISTRDQTTSTPGLSFDWRKRVVTFHGAASRRLSQRELAFLEHLIKAAPEHVSRIDIRHTIFAESSAESFDLTLNEFIRRLRKKLPPALTAAVQTVHGYGYRFGFFAPLASNPAGITS